MKVTVRGYEDSIPVFCKLVSFRTIVDPIDPWGP